MNWVGPRKARAVEQDIYKGVMKKFECVNIDGTCGIHFVPWVESQDVCSLIRSIYRSMLTKVGGVLLEQTAAGLSVKYKEDLGDLDGTCSDEEAKEISKFFTEIDALKYNKIANYYTKKTILYVLGDLADLADNVYSEELPEK